MKKIFILICLFALAGTAYAQIPNYSFETWDSSAGYKIPVGWDSPDSAIHSLGSSTYTCLRDTPGFSGRYSLNLTSNTVGSFTLPGVAVSGKINFSTFSAKSGFAYTGRPASLKGEWQYMAFGSDQGFISIFLSKWNIATSHRDTVAYTFYSLPGMIMTWTPFTIPIEYVSGATPDSAIITLSASGVSPVVNSFLYVDTLSFAGLVPAGVVTTTISKATAYIFPNPAIDAATLRYNTSIAGNVGIDIMDVSGRIWNSNTVNAPAGTTEFPLPVAHLPKGFYIVKIAGAQGSTEQKLVIQ